MGPARIEARTIQDVLNRAVVFSQLLNANAEGTWSESAVYCLEETLMGILENYDRRSQLADICQSLVGQFRTHVYKQRADRLKSTRGHCPSDVVDYANGFFRVIRSMQNEYSYELTNAAAFGKASGGPRQQKAIMDAPQHYGAAAFAVASAPAEQRKSTIKSFAKPQQSRSSAARCARGLACNNVNCTQAHSYGGRVHSRCAFDSKPQLCKMYDTRIHQRK